MKIVCLSDVHNQISAVKLPEADLLLVSGDLTGMGSIREYKKLNEDLAPIKHKFGHGIFLSEGNHDFLGQEQPQYAKELITNAKLLRHEPIEILGIKFFFSPYSKWFYDWSFNIQPGAESQRIWSQIPNDTEILITHGPPVGILDKTLIDENVGDVDLYNRIQSLHRLRLHVFGHIHPSAGFEKRDNVMYVNASTCNNKYQPINPPIVVEIDDTTHEVTNTYKYQE